MKEWVHLGFSMYLFITTTVILFLVYYDTDAKDNLVRRTDRIRLHTLETRPGDISALGAFLDDSRNFPDSACLQKTYMNPTTDAACLTSRRAVQSTIMSKLECDQHKSEYCNYVEKVVSGYAKMNSTGHWIGRNMSVQPASALRDTFEQAAKVFHVSVKATEKDSTKMLRSVLFSLIEISIFGNLVLYWGNWWESKFFEEKYLLYKIFKIIVVVGITLFGISTGLDDKGSSLIIAAIIIPPIVIMAWYEIFLPKVGHHW